MIDSIRHYLARRLIKGTFGTMLSPDAMQQMVDSSEDPKLGGQVREITPFFANVHNYVRIAEQVSPHRLMEVMNPWFEACVDAVQEEGGTLDKFIGDAVVAMFGAPGALPDHAQRACVAALKTQRRVRELREQWDRAGDEWPEIVRHFRVQIGLHTGAAMVGNIGTRTRFSYTMMGDNVNLAARLESAAKNYGVGILCSEHTRTAAEQVDIGRVVFRRLGRIIIKGRPQALELHEPAALREDATDRLRECIGVFEKGLACWNGGDVAGAIPHFEQSATLEREQPQTSPEIHRNPSTVYLHMARDRLAHPEHGATAGMVLK